MIWEWIEWLLELLNEQEQLQFDSPITNASNNTDIEKQPVWKQKNDIEKVTACGIFILTVCLCIGYLLQAYFKKQTTLALKLGTFKSKVEIFGKRNYELSRELFRTMSQLALAEERLMNKDYSMANALELSRLRGELESVRSERHALLQTLQDGPSEKMELVKDHKNWEERARFLEDKLKQSQDAHERTLLELNEARNGKVVHSGIENRLERLIMEKKNETEKVKFLQNTLESVEKSLEETREKLIRAEEENSSLRQKIEELEEEIRLEKVHRDRMEELTKEKEAYKSRLNLIENEIWFGNADENLPEDVETGSKNKADVRMKHTMEFVDISSTNESPEMSPRSDMVSNDDHGCDNGNPLITEAMIHVNAVQCNETDEEFDDETLKINYVNECVLALDKSENGNIMESKKHDVYEAIVTEDECDAENVSSESDEEEGIVEGKISGIDMKEIKRGDGEELREIGDNTEEIGENTEGICEDTKEIGENTEEICEEILNEDESEERIFFRGTRVETILEEEEDEEDYEESSTGNAEDMDTPMCFDYQSQDSDEEEFVTMYFTSVRPISDSPEFQKLLDNFQIKHSA
ncbi:hypothetical protein L9F63_017249 [Diploptera punctata]|uniref:Uncharacterized protein n=1 Tax=Diploptera punctata TaxID=6984 RepID=A0AAD8A036_DIPPU|nr:hypothetical protein L9F63_017249 [Diploptera punctata]